MNQEELEITIAELEREIARYPKGSITKKKIREKEYYYHRITNNGKRTESYIPFDSLAELCEQIEKRKSLERDLKKLKSQMISVNSRKKETFSMEYKTTVRIGKRLAAQIASTKRYKKRECIEELRKYIFGDIQDRVFILYGLRRTGKTTMIRQIITELSKADFEKSAFIQIKSGDTLSDIDSDLKRMEQEGFRYIFIDEVTLLEDFIEGAALFSDIYASSGMKIVLSGRDSLGFLFTKEEQLYDRCIMLHTTLIPYREFENVLGIKGIDEYIRYGGTMSLGGVHYNETVFSSVKSSDEYIDTAIAKNIQHSLQLYQYGGHFRQLLDLYERGELTNVINRVVENINHSFARSVIERTFKSHDISVTAANLLRDRMSPINIKEHMNLDLVTYGMMKALDILNKEEQTLNVDECHMQQIKEYLKLLDLVVEIDLLYLPDVSQKGKISIITQPGLRYCQADAIVENMLLDERFAELSVIERNRVLERLLNEIKGRMMEDIILLETKIANPDKSVFKLQFAVGEFDMVIFDPKKLNCKIFEVKYSKERVAEQFRHLANLEKCEMVTHRFGEIIGRYVIYRGEKAESEGIQYLNVEDYLKNVCSKQSDSAEMLEVLR